MRNTHLSIQTITWLLLLSLTFGQTTPLFADDKPNTAEESDGPPSSNPETVIGKGFLIRLTCPEDPKINGEFRVNAEGQVSLPYNITIEAADLKLRTFQTRLKNAYRPYFRGTPTINISIKQKRYWVKVLGLVRNPGTYLVKDRTTLDEALAMASVRTEDLPAGYARIEQDGRTRWVSMEDYLKGGPAHNLPAWQGGEQILFQMERPERITNAKDGAMDDESLGPSARKVQVLGEVRSPGGVSYQNYADGYYYLIQRGGPTRDSNLSNVSLLRKDGDKHVEVSNGDIEDMTEIHEADVLLVHPERATGFERTLQTTSVIASIISAVVLTIFVVK